MSATKASLARVIRNPSVPNTMSTSKKNLPPPKKNVAAKKIRRLLTVSEEAPLLSESSNLKLSSPEEAVVEPKTSAVENVSSSVLEPKTSAVETVSSSILTKLSVLLSSYLNFMNSASEEELRRVLRSVEGGAKIAQDVLNLRNESPEPFKNLDDLRKIGMHPEYLNSYYD